jgi:Zn-dependent protease with chaperone function
MTGPPDFRQGPADRTSFFEEQRRNRRRSLRFAVASALTIFLSGIPVSLILTPVLYLVTLTIAHLVNLWHPLSPAFWAQIDQAGRLLPTVLAQIEAAVNTRSIAPVDWRQLGVLGAALVAPGMVFMVLLWIWVRTLFRRAGSGGVLLRVGAREANPTDLEERQLGNLIDEMAIAAGTARPHLMLLDVDATNAAVVGASDQEPVVVMTRGMLSKLDRDETQGIVAHLIGSVGNGDLRIANLLMSVFQTFGLLGVILAAPGERDARHQLWRTLQTIFRRKDHAEIERVGELLAANEVKSDHQDRRSGCLSTFTIPFVLAGLSVQFLTFIGVSFVFGPLLAAMWRARRYLADATAVQLTRNPNGIAHALQRLGRATCDFEAGGSSRLVFLHWPAVSRPGGLQPSGGFHPTLERRAHRLQASGAKLLRLTARGAAVAAPRPLWLRPLSWIAMALLYALLAVGMAAMVAGAMLIMSITLVCVALALVLIHGFFSNLPQIIHFVSTDIPEIAKALFDLIVKLVEKARS